MLVENEHFIVEHYDEGTFTSLLNAYLSTRKGELQKEYLIEQCISAYLELKDKKSSAPEIFEMEKILDNKKIKYVDHRKYANKKEVSGDPLNAIRLFIDFNN